MTTPADPSRPSAPTVREIAELTARLRGISARGRDVDPAERERFLADKDALIARITDADTSTGRGRAERDTARDDLSEVARARAEHPGYVLVGPSARTWLHDPDTGRPAAPVPDDEHRAVRELLGREVLDSTEPEWVTGPDGRDDVHSTVIAFGYPDHLDDDDPPGEWVTDRNGTNWDDYGEVIDDDGPIDPEVATANADIWDDPAAPESAAASGGDRPATPGEHDDAALAEYHRTAFLPREGSRAWTEQTQQRQGAFGAALDRSGSAPEPEQERREQLARWHAEDHVDAPDDASVQFTCGGYDPGLGRD